MTYHKSSVIFDHHQKRGDCWQKEEDGHLLPIRSFDDDDDLWRSMEDLMMMHGKMLKT